MDPVWRPLELASNQRVATIPTDTTAIVETRDGGGEPERALVQSTTPIRADSDHDGDPSLVDLSLERRGESFVPRNPVVATEIGSSADAAVKLAGLTVKAGTESDQPALTEDRVFFANLGGPEADTDLLVTPEPMGAQLAWQLRSADSPEQLPLKLDLPAGASLRELPKTGGAEIRSAGGKRLAGISAPVVKDAEGEDLPASYSVDGSTLLVDVRHRAESPLYPLLVDPVLVAERHLTDGSDQPLSDCNGQSYNSGWRPFTASVRSGSAFAYGENCEGPAIATQSGKPYDAFNWGEWYQVAPNKAYIERMYQYATHSPASSCLLTGVWSYEKGNWEPGKWHHPAGYWPRTGSPDPVADPLSPSYRYANPLTPWAFDLDDAHGGATRTRPNYRGNSCVAHWANFKDHQLSAPTRANAAVFGLLSTGTSGTAAAGAQLRASTLLLNDRDVPYVAPTQRAVDGSTVSNPFHTDPLKRWVHDTSSQVAITASDVHDTATNRNDSHGLGMKYYNLIWPAAGGRLAGTHDYQQAQHPCSGSRPEGIRRGPQYGVCPKDWLVGFKYSTADMDPSRAGDQRLAEGVSAIDLVPYDVTVKYPSTWPKWNIQIDRSAPDDFQPTGTLAAEAGDFITKDSYTLGVTGKDRYSGVKSISYAVHKGDENGPVADTGPSRSFDNPSCHPENGCSREVSHSFDVDTGRLNEDGRYTVEVAVKDQLGDDGAQGAQHVRRKTFAIEVDRVNPTASATHQGIDPPRWLGDDKPVTSTVRGRDPGGSGIKEFRVEFPGGAPETRTRSCAGIGAGRCKSDDSEPFSYRTNSDRFPEEGRPQVRGTVKDAVGRTSGPHSWEVGVDRSGPAVKMSGGLRSLNPTGRDLHVAARDGGEEGPRSGVQSIELRIDKNGDGDTADADEREAFEEQTCPQAQDSCPLELDYALPSDFEEGQHKANVIAKDRAGNVTNKGWTFFVVNLLPSSRSRLGLEDWWQYDSTETGAGTKAHVNAETGNLVWHSVPIVNPGRGLSTFVNLTYNSQDRGGLLGSTLGRVPLVDAGGLGLSQDLPGLSYAEAGPGFSISVSGPTRVNEPLGGVELAALKDHFVAQNNVDDYFTYLQQELNLPVDDSTPLGDQITLTDADGTVHTFQRGEDRKWIDPSGLDLTLRPYQDRPDNQLPALPASRLTPVEKKWVMTRPDGVSHFFDSMGYLRETKDRHDNTLKYRYRYFDAISGRADDPDDLTDGNVCEGIAVGKLIRVPVGELTKDVLCILRLVEVVDPAGRASTKTESGDRVLKIDYQEGGLLPAPAPGQPLLDLPFESPIPFPGLVGGKAGRIKSITDHKGRRTGFEYDQDGMLERLNEAENTDDKRVTEFRFEAKLEGLLNDPEDDLDDGIGQDRQLEAVVEKRSGDPDRETSFSYENHQCEPPLPPAVCDVVPGVLRDPRKVKQIVNRRGFDKDFAYGEDDEANTRSMTATTEVTKAAGGQAAKTESTTHTVDDRGRPTEIKDALNQRTVLEWTPDNRVESLTEAAGTPDEARSEMDYNANGLLTQKRTYPDGTGLGAEERKLELTYEDSAGIHKSTVQDGGQSIDEGAELVSDLKQVENPKPDTGTSFTLDPSHNGDVTAQTDAKGKSATTTYDGFGQRTSQTDELGNVTRFEDYHPSGSPQTVIDPKGSATSADPNDGRTRYCYDAVGNVTRVTDPRGTTHACDGTPRPFSTQLTYDGLDRLTEETLPLDSQNKSSDVADWIEKTTAYDRNNNVESSTDGEGKATTIEYTASDKPKLVHAPGSNGSETASYGYDGQDRLIRRTDPKGSPQPEDKAEPAPFTTTYKLDPVGQRLAEVRHSPGADPDKLITSFDVDPRGNVIGMNDPRRNAGKTVDQAVDAARATESYKPRVTRKYNDVDEVTEESEQPTEADLDPVKRVYDYDKNGNRESVQQPRKFVSDQGGGSGDFTTDYSYDHRDELVKVSDPLDHVKKYTRREDGKVIAESSPRGVEQGETETLNVGGRSYPDVPKYFTKRSSYDRNGDLASRSVPFAKDQYGRSDADLKSWEVKYTRDPVGNPIQITDARGNAFDNEFFDTGNIRSTERPSWWALEYGEQGGGDAANPQAGERFKAEDGDIDTDVAQGGPQLTEREGRSENAEQSADTPQLPESDGQGNFASVDPEELPGMLPKKGKTSFRYDRELRLKAVSDGTGASERERAVSYDDAGRMTSKVWPFKAASGQTPASKITHSFGYDADGNLTSSTAESVKEVGDVKTSYGYDGYDRRLSETTPGAQQSSGAGAFDELTKFGYDPNGNLTSRETPRGVASPTAGDYSFRFAYDSLDRLDRETNPAGEAWAYRHDAAGNRTMERSPLGNTGSTPDPAYETKFEFDAAERMTKKTDPAPGAAQDPPDRETDFDYDADGNRTRTEAPGAKPAPDADYERRVAATEHDGRGLPWRQSTGEGSDRRLRVQEFDPNGNLRRTVNPKGMTGDQPSKVDDGSDSVSGNVKDATKHASVRLYDADDLLTDVFLPWGEGASNANVKPDEDSERYRQSFDRNARGQVQSVYRPHKVGASRAPQVSYTYFDSDWVASSSDEELHDPDGAQRIYKQNVRYDYDQRGNQTLWETENFGQSSKGRRISRSFFANGLLKARKAQKVIEGGEGDELSARRYAYFYNPNRSLTQMQDNDPARPAGDRDRFTNLSRDPAERELVVNETWAKGKDTLFAYDGAGNVESRKTDGARNAATSDYGDTPGSTDKAKSTSFSYDRLDRETEASVRQGSKTREHSKSWWPSGELHQKTRQRAGDSDENYSSEQWFYSPHAEKDLKRRQRHGSDAETKTTDYAYDPNGNRSRDERGDHAFNSRDQLVWWKRSKKKPGTEVSYSLDGSGAVRKKTDTAEPAGKRETTYAYNGTRLVSSEDSGSRSAYRYDDLGNVVYIKTEAKGGAQLPPVNQLPSAPQSCGELDSEGGITRYCYDEFERMVAAKGPGLAGDAEQAVYSYDGFDRRDTKRVKKGASDVTRDYGYVGTSKLLSREQSRAGETKYYDYSAEGEREGQAMAGAGGSEPSRYRTYSKDANGSVTELEDEQGSDKGADGKANEYLYDPYGELDRAGEPEGEEGEEAKLGAEAKDNPFRYEGFYYDSGVKTYDMGARQYRPESGRFLSQDRYESARGDLELQADPLTQNRYAFAGGNPVSNIEFDGHIFELSFGKGFFNQLARGLGVRRPRAAPRRASRGALGSLCGIFCGRTPSPGRAAVRKAPALLPIFPLTHFSGPAKKKSKPDDYGKSLYERVGGALGADRDSLYRGKKQASGAGCELGQALGPYLADATVCRGVNLKDKQVQQGRRVGTAISVAAGLFGGGTSSVRSLPGLARAGTEVERPASSAVSGAFLKRQLASEGQLAELAGSEGKAIAGAGAKDPLDVAPKLARKYGGQPQDYAKMKSSTYEDGGGPWDVFEMHWYQNIRTGARFEPKTKFPRLQNLNRGIP